MRKLLIESGGLWGKTQHVLCMVMFLGLTACGPAPGEEAAGQTIQVIEPENVKVLEQVSEGDVSDNDICVSNEPETISITISAAGDVTLGNYEGQDYAWSFRETYENTEDKAYFLENVQEIFGQDDMTIVNLEGVLTYSQELNPGRTYNIKGDPEYVEILTLGSVEAVGMANNHRLDFWEKGSADTVGMLESVGIPYAYDSKVGIYETKGIRIGFVSVNEIGWGQGIEQLMQDGITELKEQEVDLILACCHWGIERENYPTAYQQTFGRKCIDWGADMVIGHHPHVLQGVEEYQGKYIFYSLANFCFGANRNPVDKDTMIVQQTFYFTEGQKQEHTDLRMIPCSVSSVSSRNDYKPTPAQGDAAKRIIDRVNEYSSGFGVAFDESGYVISG